MKYTDPKKKYMIKIAPNYSVEEKEKLLGPNSQATRYPVFKDVKSKWSFDYAAEEKKRFKGQLLWAPP